MKKTKLLMLVTLFVVFPIIAFAQTDAQPEQPGIDIEIPNRPMGLQVSVVSQTQANLSKIDLSWTGTDRTLLYNVYKSSDNKQTFTKISTQENPGKQTSYSDSDIGCGITQHYYITAVNSVGESQASETVSATTPECTVNAKLQKSWANTKKSYTKSFNGLFNRTLEQEPIGNVIKKINKYKDKLLSQDFNSLIEKASVVKNSANTEKDVLENDSTIIYTSLELKNKRLALKNTVKDLKNGIKNIYTELNLLRKIKTYNDTRLLGIDAQTIFMEACPNNENIPELKEKTISLKNNTDNTRTQMNAGKYKEAKATIKLCRTDAKRITQLIKTMTKVCQ